MVPRKIGGGGGELFEEETIRRGNYSMKYGRLQTIPFLISQVAFQFIKLQLVWTEGLAACRFLGGDLASIHSQAENDAITAAAAASLSVTNSTSGLGVWIGLYRDPFTDEFRWSDGSAYDFNNFGDDDQPIDYNCTYLAPELQNFGEWGQWPNDWCTYAKANCLGSSCRYCDSGACGGHAACQMNTYSQPKVAPRQCPPGWIYYRLTNMCYTVRQIERQ